jgi:hypothetical protein
MRYPAQRSIDLQDCLPAQQGSSGLPHLISSKAISEAINKWEKARGLTIDSSQWHNVHRKEAEYRKSQRELELNQEKERRRAELQLLREQAKEQRRLLPKKQVIKKQLTLDQRQNEKERKKKYRLDNADKIREEKRLAAQKRRARMTPEEKRVESLKIQEYKRLRAAREQGQK